MIVEFFIQTYMLASTIDKGSNISAHMEMITQLGIPN